MNIVIALIIFGMIVLIHEFGHFLFARLNKVRVVEFSIGMGPRLFSIQGKETKYSIKLLPLGGSCMMYGEDGNDAEEKEGEESIEEEPKEGSFHAASPWGRFSIIAAGPLFNFVLAFVLALIIVSNAGIDKPVVKSVVEGYPAQEAGLMPGDVVQKLDGKTITFYRDITLYLYMHPGKTMDVTVLRQEENGVKNLTFTLVPKMNQEYKQYMIGIQGGIRDNPQNLLEALQYALYEVRFNITSVLSSLAYLASGRASLNEFVGPVGIVGMIGETVKESKSYGIRVLLLNLANLMLLFSANLGVMNLLPIPALDGGRLLFILPEALFRRSLNRKIEGYIHLAGFALLMLFMVFVLFNDIRRLF